MTSGKMFVSFDIDLKSSFSGQLFKLFFPGKKSFPFFIFFYRKIPIKIFCNRIVKLIVKLIVNRFLNFCRNCVFRSQKHVIRSCQHMSRVAKFCQNRSFCFPFSERRGVLTSTKMECQYQISGNLPLNNFHRRQ